MIATDTHLAILLAGLAAGETVCDAASGGEGAPLLGVMDQLGARIRTDRDGTVAITGAGNGCLLQPGAQLSLDKPVSALLVAGLVAPYDMPARVECAGGLDVDALGALLGAFAAMGIQAEADGNKAIVLSGQATANPAVHDAGGWSDPVIAAIMLTALGTPGITRVTHLPRDPAALVAVFSPFGAAIDVAAEDGDWSLAVMGQMDLRAQACAGLQEDDA